MSDTQFSALLLLLLEHRRSLLRATIVGGVLGAIIAFLGGTQYKATLAFTAQGSPSSLDGLAGIASQFGLRVPRGGSAPSPEYYRDLLTTRPVLERVASRSFTASEGQTALPLAAIVGIEGGTAAETSNALVTWLRENVVRATVSRETGVVRVSVLTESATLSRDIAAALVGEAQAFDVSMRRTQARTEREFLQARLDSGQAELRAAESRLQSFLMQNRSYRESPALTFEHDRLQRDVAFRQQVFTTLAQAFEQARLEEVRATPVISVLEQPIAPTEREPRGTVVKSVGSGLLAGGTWLVVLVLWTAFSRSTDANLIRARQMLVQLGVGRHGPRH